MPTYNPDNPVEHASGAVKRPQARFIRLGWRKVSAWGIESLCGRFRLGKYLVPCAGQDAGQDAAKPAADPAGNDAAVYALWDGHAAVWRGSNPAEGKALAARLWGRQD